MPSNTAASHINEVKTLKHTKVTQLSIAKVSRVRTNLDAKLHPTDAKNP